MNQSIWRESRGLLEELSGWGWNDIELMIRITQVYPWLETSSLGVHIFDMDHDPNDNRTAIVKRSNPPLINHSIEANDANWGLGDRKFHIQTSSTIYIPIDQVRGCLSSEAVEPTNHVLRVHLKKIVGSIVYDCKWGGKITAEDMAVFFLLAWYATNYDPHTYVEYGAKKGLTASIVASICPNIEIYGIDTWSGIAMPSSPP